MTTTRTYAVTYKIAGNGDETNSAQEFDSVNSVSMESDATTQENLNAEAREAAIYDCKRKDIELVSILEQKSEGQNEPLTTLLFVR